MKSTRTGLINRTLPIPSQAGLILDREINDNDIWLLVVGEKRMVRTASSCAGLTGTGVVLMRFINKSGSNTEKFI